MDFSQLPAKISQFSRNKVLLDCVVPVVNPTVGILSLPRARKDRPHAAPEQDCGKADEDHRPRTELEDERHGHCRPNAAAHHRLVQELLAAEYRGRGCLRLRIDRPQEQQSRGRHARVLPELAYHALEPVIAEDAPR